MKKRIVFELAAGILILVSALYFWRHDIVLCINDGRIV